MKTIGDLKGLISAYKSKVSSGSTRGVGGLMTQEVTQRTYGGASGLISDTARSNRRVYDY